MRNMARGGAGQCPRATAVRILSGRCATRPVVFEACRELSNETADRDLTSDVEIVGRLLPALVAHFDRVNNRPAKSTPTTAPLSSRVKKPRCPCIAPSVTMYSSSSPANSPNANGG